MVCTYLSAPSLSLSGAGVLAIHSPFSRRESGASASLEPWRCPSPPNAIPTICHPTTASSAFRPIAGSSRSQAFPAVSPPTHTHTHTPKHPHTHSHTHTHTCLPRHLVDGRPSPSPSLFPSLHRTVLLALTAAVESIARASLPLSVVVRRDASAPAAAVQIQQLLPLPPPPPAFDTFHLHLPPFFHSHHSSHRFFPPFFPPFFHSHHPSSPIRLPLSIFPHPSSPIQLPPPIFHLSPHLIWTARPIPHSHILPRHAAGPPPIHRHRPSGQDRAHPRRESGTVRIPISLASMQPVCRCDPSADALQCLHRGIATQ